MAEPDIVELGRIKYRCLTILPFTSLLSVVSLGLYLGYRVKYLVASHSQTSDAYEQLNSWVYLVAELGLFCMYSCALTRILIVTMAD